MIITKKKLLINPVSVPKGSHITVNKYETATSAIAIFIIFPVFLFGHLSENILFSPNRINAVYRKFPVIIISVIPAATRIMLLTLITFSEVILNEKK